MWLFLKNLAFTVFVPGTVAVLMPWRIVSGQAPRPCGVQQGLALLPLVTGAAIYFRCVWDFAVTGRGTPAPIDAPKVLVVRGLYRYVRNPMYVGVLLVIVGWTVFFASWVLAAYAASIALAFHLFIVLVEEATLRRLFGASYERYCGLVHRWRPGTPYRD